jgi:hypothetical protein
MCKKGGERQGEGNLQREAGDGPGPAQVDMGVSIHFV